MKCLKCGEKFNKDEGRLYGLHKNCFSDWFGSDTPLEFDNISRKDATSESGENADFSEINSSFFHGKFKKYSARLGRSNYILKVSEKEFPELPATEFLCNQIAEHLKIDIPNYYFINFHGLQTFVTKNFINQEKLMTLHHIYHYFKKGEKFDVENLIRIIETQTGRSSEIERFVELTLFDSLIGNHDRHGRNLAFLEQKGRISLSPFYDNPSYIGVEDKMLLGAQHNPKGKIETSQTNEPTLSDYVKEFQLLELGYVTKGFFTKIDITTILNLIEKSHLSKKRKTALEKIITERYEELKNELKV